LLICVKRGYGFKKSLEVLKKMKSYLAHPERLDEKPELNDDIE